jgi:hypothetical protein
MAIHRLGVPSENLAFGRSLVFYWLKTFAAAMGLRSLQSVPGDGFNGRLSL